MTYYADPAASVFYLADSNRDGLLDIVIGIAEQSEVYLNPLRLADKSLGLGPELIATQTAVTRMANSLSASEFLGGTKIAIPFSLFDPQGRPVGRVEAQYSLNGGGAWRKAEPVAITDTVNLTTGYQVPRRAGNCPRRHNPRSGRNDQYTICKRPA